jgi:hypothetical protein
MISINSIPIALSSSILAPVSGLRNGISSVESTNASWGKYAACILSFGAAYFPITFLRGTNVGAGLTVVGLRDCID